MGEGVGENAGYCHPGKRFLLILFFCSLENSLHTATEGWMDRVCFGSRVGGAFALGPS